MPRSPNTPKPKSKTKSRRNKPAEGRSSKAEVARRIEFCLRCRLQGAEVWDIREIVSQDDDPEEPTGHGKAWKVTDKTIYYYLQQADLLLAETASARHEELLNLHLAQRRLLYAKSFDIGDYRSALAVLDSEAKLLRLFPDGRKEEPKEEEHDLSKLTDAQLETIREILTGKPQGQEPASQADNAGSGSASQMGEENHA